MVDRHIEGRRNCDEPREYEPHLAVLACLEYAICKAQNGAKEPIDWLTPTDIDERDFLEKLVAVLDELAEDEC